MIKFFTRWFSESPPAIVAAQVRDAAGLAAVHEQSFRRAWSRGEFEQLLADRSVLAHIARAGGRGDILGFILSRIAADEAEIVTVAVKPAERRRKLGALLLQRHLGRLAALGVRRVFLEVEQDNAAALKLYARAGFDQVGVREGYYARTPGNGNALILRRDLA